MNAADNGSRCVLLVEDEALLAMLVEDILSDAGFEVLKAARVGSALALAQGADHIDAAILDVNLAGEAVFPVADWLSERGIPFVFATGYGQPGIPAQFQAAPVLQKPYQAAALTQAVSGLLDSVH